jgi:hypothetical protein
MKKITVRERITQLIAKKKHVDTGGYNATPFKDMPRTTYNFAGGFIEGKMYGITADTAGGKTKFIKATIFQMWRNYFANKIGKKFHVIFFALEEDYDEFLDSVIITIYEKKYENEILAGNLPTVNYPQLNSLYKETLPDNFWDAVAKIEHLVDDFMSHFTLSDINNPTGMYKFCKEQCEILGHGKHLYKERTLEDGRVVKDYDRYERLDENLQVIVIVDHMSALKSEASRQDNKHVSMEKWVSHYAKEYITKRWKWTSVDLLQQMFDPDRGGAYNQKGEVITRRVEPSLEKLGNNKEISRYYYVIIGLFNPYYYNIASYPLIKPYDIAHFEDNYRCGIILKNRYGLPGQKISYYFYGNSFLWKEMPYIRDPNEFNPELEEITENHRRRKIIINQNKF